MPLFRSATPNPIVEVDLAGQAHYINPVARQWYPDMVCKAVERMKGRVGVESEEGQGSRFWVELKRCD